jgi:hypothetical protein
MKKVSFKSRNGQDITISAVINFPEGFDEGKKHPAVIVAHPGGGVKELTATVFERWALMSIPTSCIARIARGWTRGTSVPALATSKRSPARC